MQMSRINILGVQVDRVTKAEALEVISRFLHSPIPQYVVTPNPEFVVAAQEDLVFRESLNKADLAIPDGVGLLMAAKFLALNPQNVFLRLLSGLKVGFWGVLCPGKLDVLPERVPGSDIMAFLAELSVQKGYSWFLVGRKGGLATPFEMKTLLCKKFPGLKIEGASEVTPDSINRVSPDVVVVTLGHPHQEKWIHSNIENLNAKLILGVGGSLDFLVGLQKRAPKFIRKLGLEWGWRLLKQPNRLKRIITAAVIFPWMVFKEKAR